LCRLRPPCADQFPCGILRLSQREGRGGHTAGPPDRTQCWAAELCYFASNAIAANGRHPPEAAEDLYLDNPTPERLIDRPSTGKKSLCRPLNLSAYFQLIVIGLPQFASASSFRCARGQISILREQHVPLSPQYIRAGRIGYARFTATARPAAGRSFAGRSASFF
jgi:hypothetical protein